MSATLAAHRKEDARTAPRCASMCARCLYRLTQNNFGVTENFCRFIQNTTLKMTLKQDDKPYNKCYHCLNSGEPCVKLPDDYQEGLKNLDGLIQAWQDASGDDKATARAEMVKSGTEIYAVFTGDNPKFSASCFLHDGKDDGDQSGVTFKGRDRSKVGMMKKAKRDAAAMEDFEDEEEVTDFGTPKRTRYAAAGTAETPRERERRLAAEAAVVRSPVQTPVRRPPPATPKRNTRANARRGASS